MCIFTGPVARVSKTRIYARVENSIQYIVYEMNLDTVEDVAMVLPVPVAYHGLDDAARFVNLSRYKSFFEDIDQLFPPMFDTFGLGQPETILRVHAVGAYDATYVPDIEAFCRLDERFRLSSDVWEAFPQYGDYGFVVFQLRRGKAKFHPMAFAFPTRDPSKTFFPTTHVHDSKVHATADFDHALYAQTSRQPNADWITSEETAEQMPGLCTWWGHDRSKGVISKGAQMSHLQMAGEFQNADVWIAS